MVAQLAIDPREVVAPAVGGVGRRICRPREEVEAEFGDLGLRIVDSMSVWPGLSMWRFYLLAIGDQNHV